MKNIALIALFTGILAGQAQAAPPVDPIWPTPADAAPSPLDLAGQLAVTFDAPPTAFKLLFNDFKSQTVRDLTRGLPPLTVNLVLYPKRSQSKITSENLIYKFKKKKQY